jgi:two-component system sensor histidine kinase LytS
VSEPGVGSGAAREYDQTIEGSEQERRAEGFVWASTGRRLASARVGRRWHEVRGPLLAATLLALVQAAVVYLALRLLLDLGASLLWLVPIVTLTTLALVAWMGLVRAAFGRSAPPSQAPAAGILDTVDAVRPALRAGFGEASARVLAYEAHARLGYAAVAVTDTRRVLAHFGLGGDHHGVGRGAPPGALDAMTHHRVTRLPVGWKHGCDARDCPLRSAIVAPIEVRGESIGSIVLFSEDALAVSDRDRATARQLGGLVSTELMVGELELQARATASAELAALQAQIEPHFLFNALNTIASFCRTQPDEARRLVLRFADYCRWSLRRPAAFVELDEELRHVEAYVALERARFGEDLDVELRIAPSARSALVPPFLVQPLVENAIKHGKGDRQLRVVVRAEVRFGRLRVTVRDNGRGIPRELAERATQPGVGEGAAGLGLFSVSQRVAAFYGDEGRLRIVSAPRLGTIVSIIVPTAPPDAASSVATGAASTPA